MGTGETKIMELEEELRVVGNNLKSLEVSEEKANQREESYKEQIKTLTSRLRLALSLLRDRCKSSKRRSTDSKMSSVTNKKSSRLSPRSWIKPSPKCLAIKWSYSLLRHSKINTPNRSTIISTLLPSNFILLSY